MLWSVRGQTLLKQWELSAGYEQFREGVLESSKVDLEVSKREFRYDILL